MRKEAGPKEKLKELRNKKRKEGKKERKRKE